MHDSNNTFVSAVPTVVQGAPRRIIRLPSGYQLPRPPRLGHRVRAAAAAYNIHLHHDIPQVIASRPVFPHTHASAVPSALQHKPAHDSTAVHTPKALPQGTTHYIQMPQDSQPQSQRKPSTMIALRLRKLAQLLHHTWRHSPLFVLWWVVYAALSVGAFMWKFMSYRHNAGMFNLAGYAICFARGSAEVVLFNGFLLLWPVMTRVQYWLWTLWPGLARCLHMEHRVTCHIVYGCMYYLGGYVHVIAHLVNVLIRVPMACETTWSDSMLANVTDFAHGPKPDAVRVLFQTATGLTGVAMLVCSLVAPYCKFQYRQSKAVYWNKWGHICDGVMFGITFAHGMQHWLEQAQAFPIMGPPLAIYLVVEVAPRYFCTRRNAVTHFTKTQDTVTLHIPTTQRFANALPGTFLRLQVPVVSPFEWHPFSITSHNDTEVTVQIQVSGDWTSRLHDIVYPHLMVRIDGPIPAPAIEVSQYKVAVLIGAGIGITPYMSTLHQRATSAVATPDCTPQHQQQLYVHWQTNRQALFGTHGDVLERVAWLDGVDVQLHLTGDCTKATPDDLNVLKTAQTLIHDQEAVDIISGLRLPKTTDLGRPDFHAILQQVAAKHPNDTIGVFFCGPPALQTLIRQVLWQVERESQQEGHPVVMPFHPEVF
ncbi:hypothetical protein DYB30_006294 [Aphanomyces astaci]|uniref:FAD-binding FR-type domain-containing protein n=1 Tax=Aphanomyces astaci TaxID=112090 RepID=A0A397DE72_APHAT|nr:hypothetical protein DYB30_006294 [Aphanomyces astaci]